MGARDGCPRPRDEHGVFTKGTIRHIDSSDGGAEPSGSWRCPTSCRWLGSPPILRQYGTTSGECFLQRVTPTPSTRSRYRRAREGFQQQEKLGREMITTAKLATGTGAALA